jgi:hypothetical protein
MGHKTSTVSFAAIDARSRMSCTVCMYITDKTRSIVRSPGFRSPEVIAQNKGCVRFESVREWTRQGRFKRRFCSYVLAKLRVDMISWGPSRAKIRSTVVMQVVVGCDGFTR